jgi:hypothetical protein
VPASPAPEGLALHPGEQVIRSILPGGFGSLSLYVFTLGLWTFWRRRNFLTLTTERVWLARGRFIWKAQRSLPLAKVQDATYKKNLGYGGVTITTAGGGAGAISKRWYRNDDAQAFVEDLNRLLREAQRQAPPAPPQPLPDIPGERLRTLARLRDEGLVTTDEFEAKKSEILTQM